MRKIILLLSLLLSSTLLFAQGLNQPIQNNNVCDTTNTGFASFNLQAISSEILNGLNPTNFTVTHHETINDASFGVNALSSPYSNLNPTTQLLYARILNLTSNAFEVISYSLNVHQTPTAPNQTLTSCASATTSFPCWNLESIIPSIVNGNSTLNVSFFETQTNAQLGMNQIANISCYISASGTPISPPVFYRIQNSFDCFSIGIIELITINCEQNGYPENLTQCSDSGNICFNLTENNDNVIGSLNPSDYTISYHLSQADATSDVNAISSPYCLTSLGTQTIFVRLENNTTSAFNILTFTITSQQVAPNVVTLADMIQCDENSDGAVIFNLTTIQAQITSTNPLEYYTSLSNATNQLSPITNPSTFTVASTTNNTEIFIREIIASSCDSIYKFNAKALSVCNVAYVCNQANSLCGALGVPFSNTVGVFSPGPAGCLGTTPNPTWFYLPVSSPGNISLMIQQSTDINFTLNNLDVDYAIYGPFTDPVTPCGTGTPLASTIVSCSYSPAPVEYPLITNALPGQYYLIMVTNFSNDAGFIKITQTAGSTGTINCSGLTLNAFLDSNSNGNQDTGEPNFPLGKFQYEINDNTIVHNIIAPTGIYSIYELNLTNSYDLGFTIESAYASLYNVTTPNYSNVTITVGGGMTTYNFPVTPISVYNDLAVTIIPTGLPRPGFTYTNKLVYANLGNQTIAAGTLTFTKDTNVSIVSVSQAGTTSTATGFTYDFTNLTPFEVRMMDVVMQVPTVPTVNADQILTNSATIAPTANDINLENNSNSCAQIVVNAYDPNDKMESHGEKILHSTFTSNDYLYYTIRFENTGTASAINVRVNDVLDSKLDESSLKMISTSHPYILDRVENNLNWKFDDILLPVSVANTTIGKGYIMFKIKPKAGYSVGDIIPNTASIYFDFNPAIITNTFITEFTAALSVNELENGDFAFYPNPTSDFVTVTLKNNSDKITSISIFDVLGKLVSSCKPNNSISQTIDLKSLNSGMYFIEVTSDNNLKVIKKLLVK